MTTHEEIQSKTFYEALQSATDIDFRDTRGKHHKMPLILLGLTLGMLRGRDGN